MILAYAGNRVDAVGRGEPRFPVDNVACVRVRVAEVLAELRPDLVVGAAAAGADLIVLAEADRASIRTHIVLPIKRDEFRQSSVADRADEWIHQFDLALRTTSGLTIGNLSRFDDWYLLGNDLILDTAEALADGGAVTALVIASPDDRTSASNDFRQKAMTRRWPIVTIDPAANRPTHHPPATGNPR